MPVVLLASMRMVFFVKTATSSTTSATTSLSPISAFSSRRTLIGVILAAVVFLCGELMATTLFGEADPWAATALLSCFKGAAAVIVGTYASAVIYFYVLFRSDEKDQHSGTWLTFAAVLLSALAYTVLGTLPLL